MRGSLLSTVLVAALVLSAFPSSDGRAAGIEATGVVYAGMYSSEFFSTDDYDAFAAAAGRRMTFGGTFHHPLESEGSNWESNTETLLEEVWQGQATPFANLEVTVSAFTVASGGHDAEITAWAGRVKRWLDRGGGRSLFIAPLQEMNGDWVPYGMDPENFKIAFRRIREIFESMGMDETRVRWVFAPNGWSTPPYSQADYYPGDAHVDLIGFSAYNFGSTLDRWSEVPEVMGGVFAEARGYAPGKPYVLSQTASSRSGGDRDAWLADMFAFVAADPNALGFVYFNLDRETDWRIWSAGSLAPGFADGMNRPSTLHVWPMSDWFQPGPLPFGPPLPAEPTIPLPTRFCFSDSTGEARFEDVPAGQFYTDPVSWAATSGITNGFADGTFRPAAVVTRAQMAVFLWRLSCSPQVDVPTGFSDVADGQFYTEAVEWLVGTGITSGTGSGFAPDAPVDRGQMAAFLHRLKGEPVAPPAGFPDVGDEYFATAVGWLADEGISVGYPDGRFHPGDAVTRAQMVTLLDRFAR